MRARDPLSATFAALADPTRRAILARLAQGEAAVGELAAPFGMTGPAITKHLRVLTQAGLIAQRRNGQFRPCRIEAAPLKEAADWTLQYRALWEQQLDQLAAYLEELQQKPAPGASKAGASTQRTRKDRRHG